MGGELLNDVARFLTQLEFLQHQLQQLFDRKRSALSAGRAGELLDVARDEAALVERLQGLLARRETILAEAAAAGFSAQTLADLLEQTDESGAEAVAFRIEAARQTSERLRRESWVQWIVAQRSYRQYAELLDLIAHRGRKSPTYGRPSADGHAAGALLDASA